VHQDARDLQQQIEIHEVPLHSTGALLRWAMGICCSAVLLSAAFCHVPRLSGLASCCSRRAACPGASAAVLVPVCARLFCISPPRFAYGKWRMCVLRFSLACSSSYKKNPKKLMAIGYDG
jgi:hypothetical protein